jgi:UDP-N-acetylglucosamine 2-epimerase (non-hydrolysing)
VVVTAARSIKILSIVGTRPEAIKIAPVALAARSRPGIHHRILATGQHDVLFDEALSAFGLAPDIRLRPIPRDASIEVMAERLSAAIAPIIDDEGPGIVLVQGDTTSAYAAAIAARRLDVPIGHVEAGLRSHDLRQPWPEERNRVMVDRLSTLLFAPTQEALGNLMAERPAVNGHVVVTGNTGIDALLIARGPAPTPPGPATAGKHLIFLTCHRRESIGDGIAGICTAALQLADRGDVEILCPVHTNPQVAATVRERLGLHPAIRLTAPLPYHATVSAMAAARIILTDSGGIQEEAPALGVPTLVLRDLTERPEGVASGNLKLVGTDPTRIVSAASHLLDDPAAHATMARIAYPFGTGGAAVKILDVVEQYFSSAPDREHPLPFGRGWIMDVAR